MRTQLAPCVPCTHWRSISLVLCQLGTFAALCIGTVVRAQPSTEPPAGSTPPSAAQSELPPAPPAPYSIPFQLRPAAIVSVVRLDTSLALYRDPVTNASGTTWAPMLLAAYRLSENFSPLVRVGMVSDSAPSGKSATALLNPVLGGVYLLKLSPDLRLALFLGITVPVGTGGGDTPNPARKAARNAGILARSAMDNAMFAVNDLTIFPGVDLAYVHGGLTVQLEATLLQLTRVRGEKDQADSARTNFTAGVHVGYFFIPQLSAAVELRHQRWLSTPKGIAADKTGTLRDTTTVAFGPRVHLQLSKGVWLRPALTLSLPLDDPMQRSSHKVLQLDVPFIY